MKQTTTMTREAHVTIRNISTVAVLKFAQYPFLALATIIIPRLLGADTYGEYALVISIITVAASVIDFGAGAELFGRFIPEFEVTHQEHRVQKLASNILALRLAIGVVASLVMFPALTWVYGSRFSPLVIVLVCLIVLLREAETVPYSLLYGLNKLGHQSAQLPMRRALSLVLVLVMFHFFGFVGAVASTLVVDLILTAVAFSWTSRHFSLRQLRIDLGFLKPYLAFDAVFFISVVLLNVWQRSGDVLIERLTGNARQVAMFDIPNQAYIVTTTMIYVAIDSLVPIFTSLLLTGREQKLREWSKVIIKYTAALAAVIFWATVFIAPSLAPLVLGKDYADTVPNGIWLLASLFPMAVTELGFVFSVSYKKQWYYFAALCCSFGTFLVASFLLIPVYGAVGGAVATFVSSIASAAVLYVGHRQHLGNTILHGVAALALSGVYAPLLLVRGGLVTDTALLLAGSVVYLGVLLLLRVVRLDEMTRVLHSLRPRSAAATQM